MTQRMTHPTIAVRAPSRLYRLTERQAEMLRRIHAGATGLCWRDQRRARALADDGLVRIGESGAVELTEIGRGVAEILEVGR